MSDRILLTKTSASQRGMTIVELLVVMGVFAILAGASFINLIKPLQTQNLSGTADKLMADIKSQQVLSLTGSDDGADHGIYFTTTSYTTFVGSAYNPSSPTNKIETLDPTLRLQNITAPNSTIIFSASSGEITTLASGTYQITVLNIQSNETKTITINRYGALLLN